MLVLLTACVLLVLRAPNTASSGGHTWLIFLAYGWAGIFVHEAGHALMGTLLGFELAVFRVTGFEIRREQGRDLGLQVKWFLRLGGGYLGNPPRHVDSQIDLWLRQVTIVAGGPAANFFTFLFCWFALTYGVWLPDTFEFLRGLMIFSLFSTAVNLAPLTMGTTKTDGQHLFDAIFAPAESRRTLAALCRQTGTPRKWPSVEPSRQSRA